MDISNFSISKALVLILVLILLVISILIASKSYFNNQEINSLSSGCLESGHEFELVITNQLTNEYSFICNEDNKL